MLFQLYHIQRDIVTHGKEMENDNTELAQLEAKKETSKKQLEEKSKKALASKQACVKLGTIIRSYPLALFLFLFLFRC